MRSMVLVWWLGLSGCQLLFPLGDNGESTSDAPTDEPACPADLDSDPENCGACGNVCASAVCIRGTCGPEVLVEDEPQPERMAANDAFVYWANLGNNTVRRYRIDLGIVETVITRPGLTDVAVDDSHVYISADDGVTRCAHTGCTDATILLPCQSGGQLALSTDHAYHYCPASATILRVLKGTGSPQQIASSQAVTGIAAEGTDVYWGSMTTNSILRSLDGANPSVVINGTAAAVSTLAIDATDVYWAAFEGVGVNRLARDGLIGTTLTADDPDIRALAVRDDTVFYTGGKADGFVRSCPLAGCDGSGRDHLPEEVDRPNAIGVTATHIYFSTTGGGTIQRVPR